MASDIVNYIKSQLEKGLSRDQIKQILLENKWQDNDIKNAFAELDQELKRLEEAKKFAPLPPSKEATSGMKLDNLGNVVEIKYEEEIVVEKNQKMAGFFSIVGQAIKLYFSNFLRLAALSLALIVIAGGALYFTGTNSYKTFVTNYNSGFISGFFIILLCGIIFLELYSLIVSTFIKKPESSYEKRSLRSFGYLWLVFLQILASISILVITASLALIMGFISKTIMPSLIIAGIIIVISLFAFHTWFYLSTFIFLEKNVTAMEALSIASSLTRNKWFFIIISYLVFAIVFVLLSAVITLPFLLIFEKDNASSIVYLFFGFPFTLAYYFILYSQLQINLAGKEIYNSPFVRNLALICSLGVIIIAGGIIWMVNGVGLKNIGNIINHYNLSEKFSSTSNFSGSNEVEQKQNLTTQETINKYNNPEQNQPEVNSNSSSQDDNFEEFNKRYQELRLVVVSLNSYFDRYHKYPNSLEELITNNYMKSIPTVFQPGSGFFYEVWDNGAKYLNCSDDIKSIKGCYPCSISPINDSSESDPEKDPEFKQKLQIQSQDIKKLRVALANYYIDHQNYPNSLTELTPKYIASIPTPPNRTNSPYPENYYYKTTSEQKNYRIFFAYYYANYQCYFDTKLPF